MLCLGLNPNCLSRRRPLPLTSLKILLRRIFSNNLPMVSRRLMGRYDEGSAWSFPGFRMEIIWACFHTGGKYCARKAALNIATRRDIARCGRYFRALFRISLWPGALLTLGPWSLAIYQCHLNRVLGVYHLEYVPVSEAVGCHGGGSWGPMPLAPQ
jgi:hypothetical protein